MFDGLPLRSLATVPNNAADVTPSKVEAYLGSLVRHDCEIVPDDAVKICHDIA
jgi:hypothetical protein